MKIFSSLYDRVLRWSRHPHAERYLAAVSFAEASFFPVPTVLMMAPMALARLRRAWWLALLTTVTSVMGGVAGYLIGAYLFEAVGVPIIEFYHAADKFEQLKLVIRTFALRRRPSRCMKCGGELTAVDKETCREELPPRTYEWLDEFFRCESCGQLFWKGTHWDRIADDLARVEAEIGSEE